MLSGRDTAVYTDNVGSVTGAGPGHTVSQFGFLYLLDLRIVRLWDWM